MATQIRLAVTTGGLRPPRSHAPSSREREEEPKRTHVIRSRASTM
jgi:hypothetical protein